MDIKKKIINILIGFLAGAVVAGSTLFCLYKYTHVFDKAPTDEVNDGLDLAKEEDQSEKIKARDVVFHINDKDVTLHTPSGFYYLTDEYVNNLNTYYSANTDGMNMFVVGDQETTGSCDKLMSISTMEDDIEFTKRLYNDDSISIEDDNQWPLSYYYYKNGTVRDGAPDDYTIKEVGDFEAQGMKFKAYYENYTVTQEYTVSENDTQEYTSQYHSVIIYSDTTNPLEIVVYCDEDGIDSAIELAKEALGAEA